MTINFEEIKKAVELLQSNPNMRRIDGDIWSVYMAGKVIRVDIKP